MITSTQFKEGSIFVDENGQIVEVLTFQHHRKSQARAVIRVKLQNLDTGAIIETSYRPEDKFKEVMVEKRPKTYMYNDGNVAYFMDNVTFDQTGLPISTIGPLVQFLTENMEVEGLYLDDRFFNIHLPANIVMTVTETVQGVKGDTVSNVMKPARVSTGLKVKVPLFVNEGDKIRVDTRTFEYLERYTEPKKG
ncbi:MAG: elongation factor P [Elusimicrobia bacterium]|nr:elongation factor P [Elusimicrobiota bacterium]